jgi:hypothetical protein
VAINRRKSVIVLIVVAALALAGGGAAVAVNSAKLASSRAEFLDQQGKAKLLAVRDAAVQEKDLTIFQAGAEVAAAANNLLPLVNDPQFADKVSALQLALEFRAGIYSEPSTANPEKTAEGYDKAAAELKTEIRTGNTAIARTEAGHKSVVSAIAAIDTALVTFASTIPTLAAAVITANPLADTAAFNAEVLAIAEELKVKSPKVLPLLASYVVAGTAVVASQTSAAAVAEAAAQQAQSAAPGSTSGARGAASPKSAVSSKPRVGTARYFNATGAGYSPGCTRGAQAATFDPGPGATAEVAGGSTKFDVAVVGNNVVTWWCAAAAPAPTAPSAPTLYSVGDASDPGQVSYANCLAPIQRGPTVADWRNGATTGSVVWHPTEGLSPNPWAAKVTGFVLQYFWCSGNPQ